MLLRLVAVLFGLSQDVYISPGSGRCDMAGNDEAVAAVIALSADDDYVLAGPAVNVFVGPFRNGMAGIFHEYSRLNAVLAVHGRIIHLAHLRRRI